MSKQEWLIPGERKCKENSFYSTYRNRGFGKSTWKSRLILALKSMPETKYVKSKCSALSLDF